MAWYYFVFSFLALGFFALVCKKHKVASAIAMTISVVSGTIGVLGYFGVYPNPPDAATYYRFRQMLYTTSTSPTLDGWELYDMATAGDGFGPWSRWQREPIAPTNKREVETRTVYRCRKITQIPVYGEWSSWSPNRVTNLSATAEEEIRTVQLYGYYYFECPNCHAHIYGWDIICPTWSGGCGKAYIPEGSWHQMYSEISWNDAALKDWGGTGKYATEIFGERYFKWDNAGTETQYRYRTVGTKEIRSEWSPYAPQLITPSETQQVESATEYRYRELADTTIYMFRRWGEWSDWSESKMEASDTVQVESITH